MKSLTIIGCGKVGRTLAKLWHEHNVFSIGSILNQTPDSSLEAKEFIGSGRVAENFHDLKRSDLWMIATPDDKISECCTQLANTGILSEGDLVMHTSGAHSSTNLGPAWASRAMTASLHPIKSFVETDTAVKTFSGTFCTFEGTEEARTVLKPAVEQIGGHFISMKSENKPLYHAGVSILCNHLCSLLDLGFTALEHAGLSKDLANVAMGPILNETMTNVLNLGGAEALTGPIARGDIETVRKQVNSIEKTLPNHLSIFKELGLLTSGLSVEKGVADSAHLEQIRQIFNS